MTNTQPNSVIDQLPHRRLEAWNWTDVRQNVSETSGLSARLLPKFDVPEGVFLSEGEGLVCKTVMGTLAHQMGGESWNIYVPADTAPSTSLVIDELTLGHGRVAMMIDKGSKLTLVEYHRAQDKGFVNLDVQVHLAKGAELTRIIIHEDPATAVRIASGVIAMETGSILKQFAVSFGAGLARLETQIFGEGEGIDVTMNGAYLLNDGRHTDMTSQVTLNHPNAHIRQTVKGVATDKARGVFQGKFHVKRPAQLTDAEMRHDALMLSDRAEIRAKPELEIYADDVACAHGNTIGALDDQALFYMRQRGIPLAQARAILTEAFLAEAFDDLADEDLKGSILAKIQSTLGDMS